MLLHELRSQAVHASSSAGGGGGGGGNLIQITGARPSGKGSGAQIYCICVDFWLVGPCWRAEKLFQGASNPLSVTLTSRHIETYQMYLVSVPSLKGADSDLSITA